MKSSQSTGEVDSTSSSESESESNRARTTCFNSSEPETSKSLLEKPLESTEVVVTTTTATNTPPSKMPAQLKLNYACICIFAFLVGTDFAVIIPTLWDRLSKDYDASGTFMGLVLSSYSLSGVVSGLVMGKLSDEVNKTKPFFLIAILFGMSGHVLYFLGINKWLILTARVVSGACLGASSVLLAYIAKTSNELQRTSVISLVMACRQIGLMLAPAFNLFLRRLNFYVFDTRILVDRKSAPGAFMALLWALSFVLAALIYKDFEYESNSEIRAISRRADKDW